jgi:hypothetical protein
LPCTANPSCWSVVLTIVHSDPASPGIYDTCFEVLPNWTVCPPPIITHWTLDTGIKIFALQTALTIDTPSVGYVSFTTADSTDEILGGTGGMWPSAVNNTTQPDSASTISFVQSKNTALFALKADSGGVIIPPSFNVFVGAGRNANVPNYKPTLILCTYDENGGLLSTDTASVWKTQSIVNVPSAAPPANDVAINSIVPNPATSSIAITYSQGSNGPTRLELFNSLGQSMGVLANGFDTQGEHDLIYNVIPLPEGTYYLRLSSGFGKTSAVVTVIH